MIDGWGEFQKDLYQGAGKKGRHPPALLQHMGSGLHAETGCRKVYAWEVFEGHKNSMEAMEMIRDSGWCCFYYFVTKDLVALLEALWAQRNTPTASFLTKIGKMQSAVCRLGRIAREARGERHWRSSGCNTQSNQHWVQAAKGWQRQSWLPTTPSEGTCMTACILHKSQKASSNLSSLTKKVTGARCGDEKSF